MAAVYKEELGRQIKRRREELGLTQRELADLAHVKEATTVSRWERGERGPTDLEAVASALQTSASQMLSELSPLNQRERRELDRSGPTQLDRIEATLERMERMLKESAGPIADSISPDPAKPVAPDAARTEPGAS
jgi:transcriptional regulator with XRE-family HTH domain